ncbi:MAG: hypothetical protein ABJN34_09940 [Litoreibacter sp.]|uniref:hypothetical protein n=1 Tax=Litoreibacter sp. TaxID=1969459 RepID=UPI0032989880
MRLTASGHAIIDEVVTAHVATQEQLTSALSHAEQDQLNALLDKCLSGDATP